MTSSEAWLEVAARDISIMPALGLWVASVELKGTTISTKKRGVKVISATGHDPIAAIEKLVKLLDAEPQAQTFAEFEPTY